MSRQNSREISNINVTLNGHEVGIERSINENAPFSDVKVLLLKGADGGVIDQQQSDWSQSDNTKVDYIKNKPTLGTASALDVPESGNASTDEVVKGDDTRLTDSRTANGGMADNVGHKLKISDGTNEVEFNGSTNVTFKSLDIRVQVTTSDWASVVDADGYYRKTIYLLNNQYMDTYFKTSVRLTGSDDSTLPTAEQIAAYNLIDIFDMPLSLSTNVLTLKAKTKPTNGFYIKVSGTSITASA